MISSPIYKRRGSWSPLFQRAAICLLFGVALPQIACGGAGKGAQTQPAAGEPSADPSTKVTLQSASHPNRSSSLPNLGHDGAEKFLKPIDDCELPQCIGSETQELLATIRAQATEAHGCYETAFKETPNIAGRLVLMMRVTHEGRSCPMQVIQNELAQSKTLVPCVRKLLERAYPRPREGCVDLQLPLRFVPEFIDADAGTTAPASGK